MVKNYVSRLWKLKKNTIILLIAEILLTVVLVIDSFIRDIASINFLTFSMAMLSVWLVAIARFEKDDRRYNEDAISIVIIVAASYYISTYLFGLISGFHWNTNDMSFFGIAKNLLQFGLYIVFCEMFRYVIVSKRYKSSWIYVLLIILLSLCDTSDLIYKCNLKDISDTVELVGYYVLPSILKNVALTYASFKVGYKPTIIYRLLLELPIYFLPFIPNTGLYLQSVINIVLPVMLFLYFFVSFRKFKQAKVNDKHRYLSYILPTLLLIILLSGVALVSGYFKYYLVTIGSGSMTPTICKGDAIIVKKLDEEEIKELNVGDVLVFRNSGKTIVHRIVKVLQIKGKYCFKTKGDYNVAEDANITNQDDVVGTTYLKIPWIGIPTVWLNEQVNF